MSAIFDYFAAIVPTVVASTAAAGYLTKKLLEHRLAKDLEAFKDEHEAALQTLLGNRAADREYELEARKRLYHALGPLRFQLLLAARDLAGRVLKHDGTRAYSTDLGGYYGKSTLYRILHPLALAELAERQIAFADFAVDPSSVGMLRFKKCAFAVFSGSSLVEGHQQVNWDKQEQHLYFDSIGRLANALIVKEDDGRERAMRFHELEDALAHGGSSRFEPLPRILHDFSPAKKPLFWLRLVAYANLCNEYINENGAPLGFEKRGFPVPELLSRADDAEMLARPEEFTARCLAVPRSPL